MAVSSSKVLKSSGDRLPVFDGSLTGQGWSIDDILKFGKANILPRLSRALDDRQMRDDRMRQWHIQYDAMYFRKNVPWEGSSALNIPTTRAIVDTLHAQVMHAFNGANPLFSVRDIDQSQADADGAVAVEKLLQFQLTTQINMRNAWDTLIMNSLKDGNCVAYVPWVRTRTQQYDAEPMLVHPETGAPTTDTAIGQPSIDETTGRANMALVQRSVIDKDQPDVVPISMLDWAMYPADSRCIESAIGCGFRFWATKNDLLTGVMNEEYNGELVTELLKSGNNGPDRRQDDSGGDPTVDDVIGVERSSMVDDDERQFQLFRLFWRIVIDKEKDPIATDCEIVIDRGSGIIIQARINPYWHGMRPFINFCPIPRDRAFYGYSECEILEHIHAERNAIRNQRVDNGTLALSPMLALAKGARGNLDRPFWKPGGVLVLDNPAQDVKPISIGNVAQSAFAEEAAAKEMAEDVSGVSSYAQGQSPSRSRTVGEISTVMANGNIKFEVMIGRLNDANNDLINQIVQLDYQYLPENVDVAITGDNNSRIFTTITRDQIKRRYRIQASGNAATANKELKVQSAETLFQIGMNSPLTQGDLPKQWSIANNYLHAIGITDPSPFFGTYQEAQEKQQQMQNSPPPSPVEMVQVSGKLDEVTTLATVLQKDPGLEQYLQKAFAIYQQAGATMASAAAAGAMHGTVASTNAEMNQPAPGSPGSAQAMGMMGGVGAIPTDPNNPRVFPDNIANNGIMALIAQKLANGAQ